MSRTVEPINNEIVFLAAGKPRTVRQVGHHQWECEGIRFRSDWQCAVIEARILIWEREKGTTRDLPRSPMPNVREPVVFK